MPNDSALTHMGSNCGKRLRFGLALLLWTNGSLSMADNTRREEADRAVGEFSRLHFFAEGMGMHISPNLTRYTPGFYQQNSVIREFQQNFEKIARHRWGVVFNDSKLAGFFNVKYKSMDVGVLGCVVCHSGKAAVQYIVGLGNKKIDV
jgi:hypothetical protein